MNARSILQSVAWLGWMGLAFASLGKEAIWMRGVDLPTPMFGLSTCVVDGKIYATGGGQAKYGPYFPTLEVYDPVMGTWTRKASMPTARNGQTGVAVGDKVYVIGGEPRAQASLPTVEAYDPATDTWTQKANMPTRRTFACAAAANGKIYIFGGIIAGEPADPDWNTRIVEEYDPPMDHWTRKADMPTPRAGAAAAVVDGKIYVVGGVSGGLLNQPVGAVEEYDPATNTWTRKVDMPTPRVFLSVTAVGDRIYAIGGMAYASAVFSTVEEYHPATNTWTSDPGMPTARYMHATCAVNGKIYAIGGSNSLSTWSGLSIVEEYDLTPPPPDFNGDSMVDGKDMTPGTFFFGLIDDVRIYDRAVCP